MGMCTRIRAAVGRNTTTAVGTACRIAPGRSHSITMLLLALRATNALLPLPGVPEVGVVASVVLTVAMEVGVFSTVVVEALVVVVGIVEVVVSVASVVVEGVGVVAGLADSAEAGDRKFMKCRVTSDK